MLPRLSSRIALAGLLAVVALGFAAAPAAAAGPYAATIEGADISFPQCGRAVDAGSFGVVGVNRGRPFTMNPCLQSQYGWAAGGQISPGVYVNLEAGQSASGYQTCRPDDAGCQAYNFGYNAAEFAFTQAYYATDGAIMSANSWWLDVETANSWSDRQDLNAAVVHGAVDYLQVNAGRTVGIYSTPRQYWQITGDLYAPAGVGNWVAGASGLDDTDLCADAFWPGAQVWFIQYENLDLDLDQDAAC